MGGKQKKKSHSSASGEQNLTHGQSFENKRS
jgi:hypothetical protein